MARSQKAGPSGSAHPYLDWAIATGFVHLRGGTWLPLLVKFDPKMSRTTFTSLVWVPQSLKSAVLIPELFIKLPHANLDSPKFNFCVLLIRKDRAASLANDSSWRKVILRADLGPPFDLKSRAARHVARTPLRAASLTSKVPSSVRNSPTAQLSKSDSPSNDAINRVVVAVIDQGIAFAHPRFATNAGTRVHYLWQQDLIGASGMINSPGVELTASAIDAAVNTAQTRGGDEDMVYRSVGGLNFLVDGYKPLARRRSHGTHVLDLAAGYEPSLGRSDRPIIAVDMPEEAVGDPAGSTLQVHAAWGLVYILDRAEAIRHVGEKLPVVVNLSYGPHDGPHDGSALFEEVGDALIGLLEQTNTPLRITLAAGNFRQSRVHAQLLLRPGQSKTMSWRLQPGGLTPSFMELWLPATAASKVEVTLRSPLNQLVKVSPTKPTASLNDANGLLLIDAKYIPAGTWAPRTSVLLSVAPTAEDPARSGNHAVAASGLWTVRVTNLATPSAKKLGPAMRVDAWIRRSDTPAGRRAKGRQSYFDVRSYKRFDKSGRPEHFDRAASAYVRRQSTLSGIATGAETYVIGGFRHDPDPTDLMPSSYTSEGPVALSANRAMKAPNWLAPSDDSRVCYGVLAAGTRSNVRVAMNGTSVAAPQAARYYADEFAAGKTPGTTPPLALTAPSNRVPLVDQPLVAGDGLMLSHPPLGRVWKNRP